ncbi:MAG: YlbF family regulator [Gemmatimonadetes bacterium]|nr:YlbF family regulator [Gemmatimonadota bacterium]
MLDTIAEKARELGRLLGQTSEYQALDRAKLGLANDRALNTLLRRLGELENQLAGSLERGERPGEELRADYERAFSELQASPVYQALVAAQANFERVLGRVNDEMAQGMEAGARSRIILPS